MNDTIYTILVGIFVSLLTVLVLGAFGAFNDRPIPDIVVNPVIFKKHQEQCDTNGGAKSLTISANNETAPIIVVTRCNNSAKFSRYWYEI